MEGGPSGNIYFCTFFFFSVEFEEPWYYMYKAEMFRKEKLFEQALSQLQRLELLVFHYLGTKIILILCLFKQQFLLDFKCYKLIFHTLLALRILRCMF